MKAELNWSASEYSLNSVILVSMSENNAGTQSSCKLIVLILYLFFM